MVEHMTSHYKRFYFFTSPNIQHSRTKLVVLHVLVGEGFSKNQGEGSLRILAAFVLVVTRKFAIYWFQSLRALFFALEPNNRVFAQESQDIVLYSDRGVF